MAVNDDIQLVVNNETVYDSGGTSVFSPADVPGLALWLDASGPAFRVVSGPNVVTLVDRSSNARDANGSAMLAAGVQNGLDGVDFPGNNDDKFTIDATTMLANPFAGGGWCVVAYKADTVGEGFGYFWDKTGGSAGTALLKIAETDGKVDIRFHNDFDGTDGLWQANGVDLAVPHILDVAYDNSDVANNAVVTVDGIDVTVAQQTPSGTAVDDSSRDLTIGNVGDVRAFDGRQFEILFFDNIPSAANQALVRQYVSDKLAIPLIGAPGVIPSPSTGGPVYLADEYHGESTWDDAYARAFEKVKQATPTPGPSRTIEFPFQAGSGIGNADLPFEQTLVVSTNMKLQGQGQWGCRADFTNAPAGTNGIEYLYDPQFHHGSEIVDLCVQNVPLHGMYIDHNLGEAVVHKDFWVINCGTNPGPSAGLYANGDPVLGDCVHATPGSAGSTPGLRRGTYHLMYAPGFAMYLGGIHQRTAASVAHISTDGCRKGMLGLALGAYGSFNIREWKVEPFNNPLPARPAGSPPLGANTHIINIMGDGGHYDFGYGYVFFGTTEQLPNYIIEHLGGSRVHWDSIGTNATDIVGANPNYVAGLYRSPTRSVGISHTQGRIPSGPFYDGVSLPLPEEILAISPWAQTLIS